MGSQKQNEFLGSHLPNFFISCYSATALLLELVLSKRIKSGNPHTKAEYLVAVDCFGQFWFRESAGTFVTGWSSMMWLCRYALTAGDPSHPEVQ